MNRYAWAVLLLSTLVLSGMYCGPQRSMNATVRVAPDPPESAEAEVYDGGEPIDDARIEYVCDDDTETLFDPTETDSHLVEVEDDRIHFFDIHPSKGRRGWDKDCVVRVTHPNYHPQWFRLDELCLETIPERQICERIAIQAELVPRTEEAGDTETAESDGADERRDFASAQLPAVEWEEDPGPPLWFDLLTVQVGALAFSLPARWRRGAYIAGGYTAGLGAMLATSAILGGPGFSTSDSNRLLLAISASTMGLLSYYNFRYASDHSSRRKYWTNFAGWNAATVLRIALAPVFNGVVRQARDDTLGPSAAGETDSGLDIGFTGRRLMLNVRF